MSNKDQLIRDLASSFGMNDIHGSKYNGSRYDSATGTFYCDGVVIPKHTIDKAISYFENQMEYCKTRSGSSAELMEMYLINTVAYNAICMLKDNVSQ